MRCSICNNPYGADGRFQPKMLKCGHTYCTDCILGLSHQNSIKCPDCSTISAVGIMGVYALPTNSTLLTLIDELRAQKDEVVVEDLCHACNKEKAVIICFNCDPVGCKLCDACSTSEHERDFAPVRAHKPIPIRGKKSVPKNMCRCHIGQLLTHYSEKTGTFACQQYLETQPEDIKSNYLPIEVVVQVLKTRLSSVLQNLEGYLKRLQASHQNISIIQSQLRETGPTTIQEIQKQFSNFQAIFQKRQNALLEDMDAYVSS